MKKKIYQHYRSGIKRGGQHYWVGRFRETKPKEWTDRQWKDWKKIRKEVLTEIKPTPEEGKEHLAVIKEVMKKIEKSFPKREVKVEIAGSVGKGTYLVDRKNEKKL